MVRRFLIALKKFLTNNIGYKIIAIIFAIILWLVVVNIQNPASTRTFTNIPVTIENEDSVLDGDHIYSIKSGKTATITVSGTRSVLSNLSASDFEAVADFSQLSLTNAVPVTVSLSSEKARYENQIDITQRTTSMVIDIENMLTKELPVGVTYLGDKPEGFEVDKVVLSPETVIVNVPQSKSNLISRVGINIAYDDIDSGEVVELEPHIYDVDGNEIEQSDDIYLSSEIVSAQFITYETKSVPITIEPFGEPADGYEIDEIILSRSEIEIKGDPDIIRETDEIELPSTLLNISNKTESVEVTVDLGEYIPEGVTFSDAEGDVLVLINAKIVGEIETETETSSATGAITTRTNGVADK